MKKTIFAFLAVAILSMGAVFAIAQTTGTDGSTDGKRWGKRGGGKMGKMHRGGHGGKGRMGGGMMFRGLDLTDEQKAQMKQIREGSKAAITPLREAMKANRQKMAEATANGAFDEGTVTTIANEGAGIQAQMTVQREKVKAQMFAVLTDEQKAKAAEMRSNMKQRFQERMNKRAAKQAEAGTE
jgi:protein CpxP